MSGRRHKAFVVSWFFAPYAGSADLDFYKRLKETSFHYDVVQVKRSHRDERVFQFGGSASIDRHEVITDHHQPRTRRTRDDFRREALARFTRNASSYELIVSHSNEVPSHAVALDCKRLAPRLPWVAYFGDVVKANPYVKLMKEYPLHDDDVRTEALTLEHADVVVCNNEQQRDAMFSGALARFRSKAVVVPHCYDPAMYATKPVRPNERFTFLHIGTLYSVKRQAEPVLKAIDRLLEIYPTYAHRFEVQFVGGGFPQSDRDAHAAMRHRGHALLMGSVPYLESLELMRQADALVNIDGLFTADEGVTDSPFLPGKLADYMGARRPIVSVAMARGATADLMRATHNLIADARLDRLAYVLKRYIDRKVAVNYEPYARYRIERVGREMDTVFKAALAGAPGVARLPQMLAELSQQDLPPTAQAPSSQPLLSPKKPAQPQERS